MDDHDGQSDEPAADQPMPLTPPPKLAVLTVFVRWRPLRWLDRPLARLLGNEPRLLSSRVKVNPVRVGGTLRERAWHEAWRHQNINGSLLLALGLGVGTVALAWGLGGASTFHPRGSSADIGSMPTVMGTTAAYCGALFGFLQAVVIFAVQIRSQRTDSTISLTHLIARRYLTYSLLGSIAGVAILNAIMALLAPLCPLGPHPYAFVTGLNIGLVPFITLAALIYLLSVVRDVGQDDVSLALPILRAGMQARVSWEARRAALQDAYIEALEKAGIGYNLTAGYTYGTTSEATRALTTKNHSIVVDIDMYQLWRVAEALGSLAVRPEHAHTRILLSAKRETSDFLHLSWPVTSDPSIPKPSLPPTDRLETHLRQAVLTGVVKEPGITDERDYVAQLERVLQELARNGKVVTLRQRLGDLATLRDAWLDLTPVPLEQRWRGRHGWGLEYFEGPLSIDVRELVLNAVQSGDPEVAGSVIDYLVSSAHKCEQYRQWQQMSEYLDGVVFAYYRCLQSPPLREPAGSQLDRRLGTLFTVVRYSGRRGQPISESGRKTLHDVVLRFALQLVHAAIRYDDAKRASEFADRIFEDREFRGASSYDDPAARPVADNYAGRTDYAAMLLVGWSLNVLKHEASKDNKAARAVFDLALGHIPSIPRQLALWELLRGDAAFDAAIDNRLGVSRWDIRDWDREYRTGKTVSRWGDDNWPSLGLRAGLMATRRDWHGDAMGFFETPPRRGRWNPAEEEKALAEVASESPLRLSEDALAERLNKVMRVIGQRARAGNADYLQYVLTRPLSRARVRGHHADALRSYTEHQGWIKAVKKSGLGAAEAKLQIEPIRSSVVTPREYLLDDNNWASGFGELVGENAARLESMALVYKIEEEAPRTRAPDTLDDLPGAIREARRVLQDKGYNANVLVLPDERRVIVATFPRSPWAMPGVGEFDGTSLGLWEDLLVMRCPYTNTSHALLLDTTKLLTHAPLNTESQPTIEIIEGRDDPELKKSYRAAEEALESGSELPDSHRISVLTRMIAPPPLAIADISAALAIDLRQAAGYVLDKKADVYHRPGCERIGEGEHESCLHLPDDTRPSACEKCKPDEWDYEAERRRRTRVEPEPQGATAIDDQA